MPAIAFGQRLVFQKVQLIGRGGETGRTVNQAALHAGQQRVDEQLRIKSCTMIGIVMLLCPTHALHVFIIHF